MDCELTIFLTVELTTEEFAPGCDGGGRECDLVLLKRSELRHNSSSESVPTSPAFPPARRFQ